MPRAEAGGGAATLLRVPILILLAAAPWVTGAIAATLGGWACDGLTRRRGIRVGARIVVMVGLLVSGGFILAAATASGPYLAVVYLSLCLGGQQFTDSAYWAAATSVER